MSAKVFSAPVTVAADGMLTTVWTPHDAYDFLSEWPPTRRNGAHTLALNACLAAQRGEIDLDLAEEAFRGFAWRHGILRERLPQSVVTLGASDMSRGNGNR